MSISTRASELAGSRREGLAGRAEGPTGDPVEVPWFSYLTLVQPRRIALNLEAVRRAGMGDEVPNLWQLSLGVFRMWHRLLFRSETVGLCVGHPVRANWRARLLGARPLRFPFLVKERAVAPLDLTGLASSPERMVSHLLGAHHDGNQFAYDLEILSCYPGRIAELRAEAAGIVENDTPRSRWLRDLTVYETYHERLLAAVRLAEAGAFPLSPAEAANPDISFRAFLAWCKRQPADPGETFAMWRRGLYAWGGGRKDQG